MERAQPHEVGATLFELHVATHHLDHVDAGKEFLDEVLGDGHVREKLGASILGSRFHLSRLADCLFRGQTNRTIQTDDFAIEHIVFKNMQREFGVVLRRS